MHHIDSQIKAVYLTAEKEYHSAGENKHWNILKAIRMWPVGSR